MYLDVYFTINCLMNGCVLKLCTRKYTIGRWRLIGASAVGAAGACIWEVCLIPQVLRPAGILLLSWMMVVLCVGTESERWKRCWIELYIYSFLMAGVLPVVRSYLSLWVISVLISYSVLKWLVRIKTGNAEKETMLVIQTEHMKWRVKALIDNGHVLKDPVSGKPVLIVRAETLQPPPAASWPILFRTVQGRGLMLGFWPDEVRFRQQIFHKGEIIVGISDQWRESKYQALIPGYLDEEF